jgi:hypothetical protein
MRNKEEEKLWYSFIAGAEMSLDKFAEASWFWRLSVRLLINGGTEK